MMTWGSGQPRLGRALSWALCITGTAVVLGGTAESQPILFDLKDVTATVNVDHDYIPTGPFTERGGVAIGDYNDDGRLDIYLANNIGRDNKLYRNSGTAFQDVATQLGVAAKTQASAGALFLDYDTDGDLDLLVFGHLGESPLYFADPIRLYRNIDGQSDFHEVTSSAGFAFDPTTVKGSNSGWYGGACAGDLDEDGRPEVFVTWWDGDTGDDLWRLFSAKPNPHPGIPGDQTYTPWIFVDQTKAAGLDFDIEATWTGGPVPPAECWQPMFVDLDRDGKLDIHVAIDFGLDYQFMNQGDNTFIDVAAQAGMYNTPTDYRNDMGVNFGDFDNDGDQDIHQTNFLYQDRMLRNDSLDPLTFTDVAPLTGLNNSAWGWGTVFADMDNDRDLDHMTVSGFKFPTAFPFFNRLHVNEWPITLADGITPAFIEASGQVPDFSKTNTPEGDSASGLVAFDYDNDGDLDVIVTRQFDKAAVYENTLPAGNLSIQLDLIADNGSRLVSNSRIWLRSGGVVQYREIYTGSSFLSQEPSRVHFGLGTGSPAIDWAIVRWPGGNYQIVPGASLSTGIETIHKSPRNDIGDLNGDRRVDRVDERMLALLVSNPAAFDAAHPNSPGRVTGDIDANGVFDSADQRLWSLLQKE